MASNKQQEALDFVIKTESLTRVLKGNSGHVIDEINSSEKGLKEYNFFLVKDRGSFRPIFPLEIALYENSYYWEGPGQEKIPAEIKSFGINSSIADSAVRDGIIFELISELKKKKPSTFKLFTQNSLPIVYMWLEDLFLLYENHVAEHINDSGYSIIYSELRICKNCLATFDDRVPDDRLCSPETNEKKCDSKAYKRDFINKISKDVEEASVALLSCLITLPAKAPVRANSMWKYRDLESYKKKFNGLDIKTLISYSKEKIRKAAKRLLNKIIKNESIFTNTEFNPYLSPRTTKLISTVKHHKTYKKFKEKETEPEIFATNEKLSPFGKRRLSYRIYKR